MSFAPTCQELERLSGVQKSVFEALICAIKGGSVRKFSTVAGIMCYRTCFVLAPAHQKQMTHWRTL